MSEDTKPAVDLLSGDAGEEAEVPPSAKDMAAKYSIGDDDDIDKLEGEILHDINETAPSNPSHNTLLQTSNDLQEITQTKKKKKQIETSPPSQLEPTPSSTLTAITLPKCPMIQL